MRFHKDPDNRFRPMPPAPIDAPPSRNAKYGMRGPGTFAARLRKRQSSRAELLSHESDNTDESPMITACYEAHLALEAMLGAFAELRGDG